VPAIKLDNENIGGHLTPLQSSHLLWGLLEVTTQRTARNVGIEAGNVAEDCVAEPDARRPTWRNRTLSSMVCSDQASGAERHSSRNSKSFQWLSRRRAL